MDTYIIQSSDNQQFELSIDQINKYPVLRNTLTDIDAEPGSTLYIPFSADLLTVAFNNDYNQPMDLDKLVKVIQLVSYLGLEEETDTLLKTLVSYFQHKFTAPQVEMIKYEIEAFDSIMLELFLSKKFVTNYHSSVSIVGDQEVIDLISAEVYVTSANLDYILVKLYNRNTYSRSYSRWYKNNMVAVDTPQINNVPSIRELNDHSIHISNDGKYYKLVKNINVGITTYDISPVAHDGPVIGTIPMPNYRGSILKDVRISVDLSKYMFLYGVPNKPPYIKKMFIGSVAEPQKVVSLDIIFEWYLSPLFNTIISFSLEKTYTIYHIENNQLFTKSVTYYKPFEYGDENSPKFFFSYDGKMIAEVNGDSVHILNSRGDSFVKRNMPQGKDRVAITNEYLITYNTDLYELHFWSIEGLSNATNPTFAINTIINKEISTNVSYSVYNLKVIMGENNSFLLTRNIIKTTKGTIREKFLEWTKYEISPYDTMDQFYASLTD